MLWLEALGAVLLAAGGAVGGLLCARLPRRYWMLGYFLPLLAIITAGLVWRVESLAFVPPFSLLAAGRNELWMAAAACPMILATPLPRLSRRRQRSFLAVLIAVVSVFVLSPLVLPAFLQGRHARLRTNLDHRGICLQTTIYTCGPAAAVTVLRRLGLPAEEGELAILARTNPLTGTGPDCLRRALAARYRAEGLVASCRRFESLEELKATGLTIAVIKYNVLADHYVAVLEVSEAEVVVGDPLAGRRRLAPAEFEELWRHAGVVVGRPSAPEPASGGGAAGVNPHPRDSR
jgi:predicted double-glycine peptidase